MTHRVRLRVTGVIRNRCSVSGKPRADPGKECDASCNVFYGPDGRERNAAFYGAAGCYPSGKKMRKLKEPKTWDRNRGFSKPR
jgi:hypothetical protein